MSSKFEGQTLPFTQHGWTREFKIGTFRNGASYKQVEKVRKIGKGTMGATLEDIHIIASWDVDQGGNKTTNTRKGQHFLSLKKGKEELAFAINDKKGNWQVLSYDCSFYSVVKTQREAEEILNVMNWRKWFYTGGEKK